MATNRNVYNGFEFGFNTRLKRAVFFAGYTIDRVVDTACDAGGTPSGTASGTLVVLSGTTPGALTNSVNDPNNYRFCDQSGSLFQNLGKSVQIPFRHEFKLAGNVPVWKGIELSAALQSDPELSKAVNWSITSTTRYPFDCSVPGCTPGALVIPAGVKLTNPSETIPLVAPGSRYLDRLLQLDLGVRKVVHVGEAPDTVASDRRVQREQFACGAHRDTISRHVRNQHVHRPGQHIPQRRAGWNAADSHNASAAASIGAGQVLTG
jgi:hypothetical protein